MQTEELHKIEELCALVFGGQTTPSERMNAHKTLLFLQMSASYIEQCKYILENSQSDYALLFASQSLIRIMKIDWRNVNMEQKFSLHQFLVEQIQKKANDRGNPKHFIVKSLIRSLCFLIRKGWIEDTRHHTIINVVVNILSKGQQQDAILGLIILQNLVTEIDLSLAPVTDSSARRTAQVFREEGGLTRVFQLSLNAVEMSHNNQDLLKESLKSLLSCLSYDFIGNGPSDRGSHDDVAVYFPVDWAQQVARAPAVRNFFSLYQSQWNEQQNINTDADSPASLILQCLVYLASCRRAMFDLESRQAFLDELLAGTTLLMAHKLGFSHSEACVHHMSRLLYKIKHHFQFSDLAGSKHFISWLQNLTTFTETALYSWKAVSVRTVHYLVELWGAIVAPTLYIKTRSTQTTTMYQNKKSFDDILLNAEQVLGELVPRVLKAFVMSRCEFSSAGNLIEMDFSEIVHNNTKNGYDGFGEGIGGIEDNLLDDEELFLEYISSIPGFARFRFLSSNEMISSVYQECLVQRQNAIQSLLQNFNSNDAKKQLIDAHSRLTILTYIIGAIIGSSVNRVQAQATERLNEINAELCALVFRLILQTKDAEDLISRNSSIDVSEILLGNGNAGWKLELSVLYFIQCFQTLYIESCAREDASEIERLRKKTLGFQEDENGYLTLVLSNKHQGVTLPTRRLLLNNNNNGVGRPTKLMSSGSISLPASPSSNKKIQKPAVSFSAIDIAMEDDDDNTTKKTSASSSIIEDDTRSVRSTTVMPSTSPSMEDIQKDLNKQMTDSAGEVHKSIASRLGLSSSSSSSSSNNNNQELLDLALLRIFGLLQHAHNSEHYATFHSHLPNNNEAPTTTTTNNNKNENLNKQRLKMSIIVVQRALSTLYQLAAGVTVVHTGARFSPRFMSSGRVLLETEVIQQLLRDPSPQRFPLLLSPKHGRARTFLMATLSKLLFMQSRQPAKTSSSSSSTSGMGIYTMPNLSNITTSSSDQLSGLDKLSYTEADASLLYSQGKANTMDEAMIIEEAIRTNGMNAQERGEYRFIRFIKPMTNLTDGLIDFASVNLGLNNNNNTNTDFLISFNNINGQSGNNYLDAKKLYRNDLRSSIIGLCRDLRGIIGSAEVSRDYTIIYSWLFPNRIKLLSATVMTWFNDYEVMIPLLKLSCEIVNNRGSRITFKPGTSGGVQLFIDIAKILINFGRPHVKQLHQEKEVERQRADMYTKKIMGQLAAQGHSQNIGDVNDSMSMSTLHELVMEMSDENNNEFLQNYSDTRKAEKDNNNGVIELSPGVVGPGITMNMDSKRIKCVRIMIICLSRMLNGRFANLGVFDVFNDPSLREAFNLTMELALANSPRHLASYPKIARAFVVLINIITDKMIHYIIELPTPMFSRLIAFLGEALDSDDTSLSTPASRSIESIAFQRCYVALYTASGLADTTIVNENKDDDNHQQPKPKRPTFSLSSQSIVMGPNGMYFSPLSAKHEHTSHRIFDINELNKAVHCFAGHEISQPRLFKEVLRIALNKIFKAPKSIPNLWSVSRQILPLVLCNPDAFEEYKNNYLSTLSNERRNVANEKINELFSRLVPAIQNDQINVPQFCLILRSFENFTKDLCALSSRLNII